MQVFRQIAALPTQSFTVSLRVRLLVTADPIQENGRPGMLFRLLYRAKANYPPFTYHDLEILRVATRFNEDNDLTGFLVRSEIEYFQILEGDEDTVITLTHRIARDKRIYAYSAIWSGAVDARMFGMWSMGFHMLGAQDNGLPHRLSLLHPRMTQNFKQKAILDIAQLALEKHKRAVENGPF